jgi:hypothetical protein
MRVLVKHDLFGKPAFSFPDHAMPAMLPRYCLSYYAGARARPLKPNRPPAAEPQ